MIGILTLHVVALLSWCAALLLLLGILASAHSSPSSTPRLALVLRHNDSLARFLFTRIASPVALLAIFSGTAVFLVDLNTAPWLIVKLTLVTILVTGHGLAGMLVIRLESNRPVRRPARLLAGCLCLIILVIFWLVLSKPDGLTLQGVAAQELAS